MIIKTTEEILNIAKKIDQILKDECDLVDEVECVLKIVLNLTKARNMGLTNG